MRGDVGTGDAEEGEVGDEAEFMELAFLGVPEGEYEEEEEEHAETYHDTEAVEDEGDVGDGLVGGGEIAVAEVGVVGPKELEGGVGGGLVAGIDGLLVVGKGVDGHAAVGHALLHGEDDAAVLGGVALDDVADAGHEGVGIVVAQDGEHAGNLDGEGGALHALVGKGGIVAEDAEEGKVGPSAALVEALHGGELHGLGASDVDGAFVAGLHGEEDADEADNGGEEYAAAGEFHVAALEDEPAAHANDEAGGEGVGGGDGVGEFAEGGGGEEDGPEVLHFVAGRVGVECHAHGILHPGVGHEYPKGRDVGAHEHEPSGDEVETTTDFVPAEEHDGHEGGFHEEGEDALDGQGCAEDVADEPGVVAPVGAELEFEDEAGGHADGEVDAEEFHPEFGGVEPVRVAGARPDGFHDGHHEGEAQGEGYEHVVVHGREGKLPT